MNKTAQNFFPKIIPTILEPDIAEVERKLSLLAGDAPLVQIDIVDGQFVEGKTFLEIEKISMFSEQFFEVDLMVENPMDYLKQAIPNVIKICAHIENNDIKEFLSRAHELKYVAGVAINPETPLEALDKVMDAADYVQFLSVKPGGQGHPFLPEVLTKITQFKKKYPEMPVQVDGGIKEQNIKQLLQTGIDSAVIGSAIVRDTNPRQKYLEFTNMTKTTDANQISSLYDVKPILAKKIAFLGGASWQSTDQPYKDAFEVAKVLAANNYEVVNGGGPGVMEAATKGAHAAGKRALAITYHPNKPKRHYEGVGKGNDFDEEILTLDYFDRTKVMLQNADVHIVFKGSIGTLSEFGMTWVSSWIHEPNSKTIVLYGAFWNKLLDTIEETMLIPAGERDILKVCTTPQEVLDIIKSLS